MSTVQAVATPDAPSGLAGLRARAADYLALTKPRLSSLVIFTTGVGIWFAPESMGWGRATATLLATALLVGAANAFNCYIEREHDRHMVRTRHRPLPAGRLRPASALAFGFYLSALSLPVLTLSSNYLTGALGLLALVSYVLVYTPLKQRTGWALIPGAIPGALPPLMGWTAAMNRVDAVGLTLFAILFFWQLPHFVAIALFRKAEYSAAGLRSLPADRGDEASRIHAVASLAALLPISFLPFYLGVAGPWYALVAAALSGAFFAYGAWGSWRRLGAPWARRLFAFSLVYLPVLMAALLLDSNL